MGVSFLKIYRKTWLCQEKAIDFDGGDDSY